MNDIFEKIWERKFVFFSTFFVVFTLSYIVLLAIDFLPEAPKSVVEQEQENENIVSEEDVVSVEPESEESVTVETTVFEPAEIEEVFVTETNSTENIPVFTDSVTVDGVKPLQISIAKLGKTVTVHNPTSRSIVDLDAALLDGVVRHPDSATLSQEGNVFILGHSSYLPQVFNKNFQAFNGIQNLEWGDRVEVFSADKIYVYRVEKVYRAKAQDVTVPIAGTGYMLTLATCNSFGSVDDRYIVEAKRIEVKEL
jgi:LPXTG-site transpeptidase (sortase) family protein